MLKRNRVVITGLGVLAANGTGKEHFWNALCRGESGIAPVTLCDVSELPCKIAGEVKNFDPDKYLEGKIKAKRLSRTSQLAVAAAKMAVEDAGKEHILEHYKNIPIRIGSAMGGLDLLETQIKKIPTVGAKYISPHLIGCVHTAMSTAIAATLDIETNIKSVSTTCIAGLDAIIDAAELIKAKKAEIAFAGGSDAPITTIAIGGLSAVKMLTSNTFKPEEASRPFDLKREGGLLAEGSAIVVLESLNHALARGAKPYAEIISFGTSVDQKDPPCSGLTTSMNAALGNAGLMAQDIDVVYAHGSSDIALDKGESDCIKQLLGGSAKYVPVTSIKGSTGNPFAAGGALQVVAAALGLDKGTIPPTANYEFPDPDCDIPIVQHKEARHSTKIAMINSHGIGNVNISVVLKKFER